MKDVAGRYDEWDLFHLDDVLASQYQSSDWTQHTSYRSSICWGNLLAPGNMHVKTSHETSFDMDSCFDHH